MKINLDFIKKLKDVNIDDLKNIDFFAVKDKLFQRPDVLIIIGAILITLIGTFHLYNSSKTNVALLEEEAIALEKKLEAIEKLKKIEANYNKLIKDFPKSASEQEFMNILSKLAFDNNIEIKSFSPAKKQTFSLADITRVNLHLISNSYQDMVRFIESTENSPYSIRIEQWSGKMEGSDSSSGIIASNIKINSIEIKK